MKTYFNTLAILTRQKLISDINIWVLRPKPRLVSTALDSMKLHSKGSQGRISAFWEMAEGSPWDSRHCFKKTFRIFWIILFRYYLDYLIIYYLDI